MKTKTIWIREYQIGKYHFAIKKYKDSPVGCYGRIVDCYAISVSPKRTSWYNGFRGFHNAKKFAISVAKYRKNNGRKQ